MANVNLDIKGIASKSKADLEEVKSTPKAATQRKTGKVSKAASEPKAKGRPCSAKGRKMTKVNSDGTIIEGYCKTINIAVDKEILDKVNKFALPGRNKNLTEYINLLINKDIEKNLEKYKKELTRPVNFD